MLTSTGGAGGVDGERVLLALSEPADPTPTAAPWIGPIVALGGMARRYAAKLDNRQLVVALSVPRRDFAAVLLACGWVISASEPELAPPDEMLRSLAPGTPVRATTANYVFEDYFEGLEARTEPEARFRKWRFVASHLLAIAPLSDLNHPRRDTVPRPGALARWKGLGRTWDRRVVACEPDIVLIGTASRLRADLDARVTTQTVGSIDTPPRLSSHDAIANLLLPDGVNAVTQLSSIRAAARLVDEPSLPSSTRAAVLDGYGAIKFLGDIESPFVFCVLDRSVANDASAELLVQYRNSRGEPVSLSEGIGWRSPAGVEAMAFITRL